MGLERREADQLGQPGDWRNPGWYEERDARRLEGQGKVVDSEPIHQVGQKTKVNRGGGSGV